METRTAEAAFADYMEAKRARSELDKDELDSIEVTALVRMMADAKDAYLQAVRTGATSD